MLLKAIKVKYSMLLLGVNGCWPSSLSPLSLQVSLPITVWCMASAMPNLPGCRASLHFGRYQFILIEECVWTTCPESLRKLEQIQVIHAISLITSPTTWPRCSIFSIMLCVDMQSFLWCCIMLLISWHKIWQQQLMAKFQTLTQVDRATFRAENCP